MPQLSPHETTRKSYERHAQRLAAIIRFVFCSMDYIVRGGNSHNLSIREDFKRIEEKEMKEHDMNRMMPGWSGSGTKYPFPPNEPSELDKAVKEVAKDVKQMRRTKHKVVHCYITDVEQLLLAAKRVQELEKERDGLANTIHQQQFGRYGIFELQQKLSQLRTEFKNALEALSKQVVSEHVISCPDCIQALHFNLSADAAGKLKLNLCREHLRLVVASVLSKSAALSTPLAIETMKEGV